MTHTASRYHDISCGHRVHGHESKCAHLHGHNYRVHFDVESTLDALGRVVDFSCIKEVLCEWLETNWDHKFLVWEKDPSAAILSAVDPQGVVLTPFNPTAENMAEFLVNLGRGLFLVHGLPNVTLVKVTIEETRKCSASFRLPDPLPTVTVIVDGAQ